MIWHYTVLYGIVAFRSGTSPISSPDSYRLRCSTRPCADASVGQLPGWMSGCLAARGCPWLPAAAPGCPAARLPGYLPGLPGCPWLPGCPAARLPGLARGQPPTHPADAAVEGETSLSPGCLPGCLGGCLGRWGILGPASAEFQHRS